MFECAAGASEDCVGTLSTPPYRDEDGAVICGPCAKALEISFPGVDDE
jgi:hypothetical protein